MVGKRRVLLATFCAASLVISSVIIRRENGESGQKSQTPRDVHLSDAFCYKNTTDHRIRLAFVAETTTASSTVSRKPLCEDLYRLMARRDVRTNSSAIDELQTLSADACTPECDDILFRTPETRRFRMSDDFRRRSAQFFAFVDKTLKLYPQDGADSYAFPVQYRALHFIAGLPFVRTVCETGLAVGRSSFNFLTANPHVVVHSFDDGRFEYARRIAEFLRRRFPRRFFAHFGDSRRTLPALITAAATGDDDVDFRCDVMFVDGDHRYDAGRSDLLNFAVVARRLDGNLVVFDDYPRRGGAGNAYGRAWEQAVGVGYVRERMRCRHTERDGYQRGFAIGSFVKRPDPDLLSLFQ